MQYPNSIEVVGINKVYKLYVKPIDRLKEVFSKKKYHQVFTSLSDISFEITKGGCLGIIGDNGAGKSTLLKILSNTLSPSSGNVKLDGRVGALLELGTGFHPELTGRQNYYTYAALLGLSKSEVKEKENDILAFAEIGNFIDQPVKTYSSGMSMRLGFAIATSIDPDILIIDEALSVGDQYFQKKSIDRMISFKENKKTLVFCSHSMYHINLLCERTMWLKNGKIEYIGPTKEVTALYENYQYEKTEIAIQNIDENNIPNLTKWIKSIKLNGKIGIIELQYQQNIVVDIETVSIDDKPYAIAFGIQRNDGVVCNVVDSSKIKKHDLFYNKGTQNIKVVYSKLPFLHGEFFITVYLLDDTRLHLYHQKQSEKFIIKTNDKEFNEIGLLTLDFSIEVM